MTLKNDCVFKVKYGVEKCPSKIRRDIIVDWTLKSFENMCVDLTIKNDCTIKFEDIWGRNAANYPTMNFSDVFQDGL
jgi:hypothetical protein